MGSSLALYLDIESNDRATEKPWLETGAPPSEIIKTAGVTDATPIGFALRSLRTRAFPRST